MARGSVDQSGTRSIINGGKAVSAAACGSSSMDVSIAQVALRGAAELAAAPALAAAVLGLGRERVLEGLRAPRPGGG
jgi:hypothetical protein